VEFRAVASSNRAFHATNLPAVKHICFLVSQLTHDHCLDCHVRLLSVHQKHVLNYRASASWSAVCHTTPHHTTLTEQTKNSAPRASCYISDFISSVARLRLRRSPCSERETKATSASAGISFAFVAMNFSSTRHVS
jgi:hypothetical protein